MDSVSLPPPERPTSMSDGGRGRLTSVSPEDTARRPSAPGWRDRNIAWVPWTVLAVSLSISVWAYQAAETALSLRDMIRFDGRVEDIRTAIRDRMQVYEQALHGARGLFAASKSVERLEWREYISSINISKSYPGVK